MVAVAIFIKILPLIATTNATKSICAAAILTAIETVTKQNNSGSGLFGCTYTLLHRVMHLFLTLSASSYFSSQLAT